MGLFLCHRKALEKKNIYLSYTTEHEKEKWIAYALGSILIGLPSKAIISYLTFPLFAIGQPDALRKRKRIQIYIKK